jgi:hypothetical protein
MVSSGRRVIDLESDVMLNLNKRKCSAEPDHNRLCFIRSFTPVIEYNFKIALELKLAFALHLHSIICTSARSLLN